MKVKQKISAIRAHHQAKNSTHDLQMMKHSERFQILMVVNIKRTLFWDVAPRSLAETDQCFRGGHCFHQGDEWPS
jgi:hypothetical protein